MGYISANAITAVTPEQAAVWCYPKGVGDLEETAFNFVNCVLNRVHMSGHLAKLSAAEFDTLKEGMEFYKTIRKDIASAKPFFPMGTVKWGAKYHLSGLKIGNKAYCAFWNFDNTEKIAIDIKAKSCKLAYPKNLKTDFAFDGKTLAVIPHQKYFARLFIFELL